LLETLHLPTKQQAAKVGITTQMAHYYLSQLFVKYDAAGRMELMLKALAAGDITNPFAGTQQ
jgi:hypothetical protein